MFFVRFVAKFVPNNNLYDMKVTKDDLLKQSGYLFIKYGFAGCKLDAIAEKVGLKKTSLFAHFKSKEDLYERSVNENILLSQNPSSKYEIHLGTLRDFLDDYIIGVEKVMEKGKENDISSSNYYSFLQEIAYRKPEFAEKVRMDNEDAEIELWTNQIKAAQLAGEVKNDIDPFKTAQKLRYSYVGYCYFRAMQGGATMAQIKKFLLDFYDEIRVSENKSTSKAEEEALQNKYKGINAIIF